MKLGLYSGDQYICDLTQLNGPDFVTGKLLFHSPVFNMKAPLLNIRLENGKMYRISKVTKGFSEDGITKDTYNAQLVVDDMKCSGCSHSLKEHYRKHHYPERGVTLLECTACKCVNFKD
jgi:hypothetical protein